MKKTLIGAVFLLLCILFALCAAAEQYSEGYFLYTVTDDSVTITGYFGREENVQVPSTIAGLPVNTIGEGAFVDTGASSVTLPDTVTTVQENAIGTGVRVSFDTGPTATPEVKATPAPTQRPETRPARTEAPAVSPTPAPAATWEAVSYEETEDELTEEDIEAARLLTESTEAQTTGGAFLSNLFSTITAAMLAVILAVCTLFV